MFVDFLSCPGEYTSLVGDTHRPNGTPTHCACLVAPFIPDVRQDGRECPVVQCRMPRHDRKDLRFGITFSGDFQRSFNSMQDDQGQSVLVTYHPFRPPQGRSKTIQTASIISVTTGTRTEIEFSSQCELFFFLFIKHYAFLCGSIARS